jgi:Membrane domain of glycerophosphoryl diester phosphodiesterase
VTHPTTPTLDFQDILHRSLSLMATNAMPLAILAGLLVGIPSLIFGTGALDAEVAAPGIWEGWSVSGLLLMVGQAMLHAAVTIGLLRQLTGAAAQSLNDLLTQSWGAILAVITVSLTKGIVIGFCYGFFNWGWWLLFPILFLAAAVWLSAAWLVAIPAAVDQKLGVGGALGQSMSLTKPHRWTLVGYIIVLWVLTAIAAKVIAFVFGIFSLGDLAHIAVQIASAALDATLAVVVYHRLRGDGAQP